MKHRTQFWILVGMLAALVPLRAAEFSPRHKNIAEIRRIAKGDSRCSLQEFGYKENLIAIIQVDFNSGAPSSLLMIYAKGQDDWFRAVELAPISGDAFIAIQDGDRVTLSLSNEKKVILVVSLQGLCVEPQKAKTAVVGQRSTLPLP